MCGIAGIYHFNQDREVRSEELKLMADAIQHRGPDNSGVFVYQNIGLAYRRLSIIDTTEQKQPILTNEDQTLRIVFNGEIYNFREIKEELIKKGHRFYTKTDTEMILHLYEEEGEYCVKRLNGIFAFAILDTKDNSLFLARDQMGIKPLYYTQQNNKLAFASEIKAILSLPWVNRKVNTEALGLYFKYRFVPDPLSIFEGIYKLLPGHWMRVTTSGVEIQQYWSLRQKFRIHNSEFRIQNEREAVEFIRNTLQGAVKRQLVSDVPLGAFLSGGIDSSIVVGLMSQMMKEPVKTFSIGFSEKEYDETNYARQISQRFHTNHHENILKPEHVQQLPEIIWHLDEPLADPAAVPTCFLSQMARKDVTVVLTGEGGDELFAGYKEDFNYRLGNWLNFLPKQVRFALAELVGDFPDFTGKTRLYRSLLPDQERAEHVLIDLFRFDDPPVFSKNPGVGGTVETYKQYLFDDYWQKTRDLDWLNKMLYLETKIWLPGDPLMKVDKMTMAHGLEARVPILDLEIVELAAQIPAYLKNKNRVEKYLLRKAFADLLPEEIFNRPKTAFELPVGEWLKNELKPMTDEYLSVDRLKNSEFLDAKRTQEVVNLHMQGKKDYKYELWALLVYQMWEEKWFS